MIESRSLLPYGRQSIDDDDLAAVVEALRSDFLTTGPRVEEFEHALADFCGAKHAIAVSNCTAAMHIALLAAGLKQGDRLLTSALTFVASANCAEYVGATADFADIDARTYNVTAETLQAAWQADVRAVVAVDFAGQPCRMRTIAELARGRGAIVVEDAAHAIGSSFEEGGKRYRVGGHPWADMTCFSFHPVKTMTTGEGSAILTDDDRLASRCRLFRSHGMTKQPEDYRGLGHPRFAEAGPWYYEMHEVGYNYRLTDFQCALGMSQLRKIDRFIARRSAVVARYNAAFSHISHLQLPYAQPWATTAWHLYAVQIDFDGIDKTRTQVMTELKNRGIGTQVHYIPVHLQPYYRNRYGYGVGKCAVAESYYEKCLSLPLFPAMTDADVERVIEAVTETVAK